MTCAPPPTARRRSSRDACFAPDLVILDLGLPKIDGIDVARSLRAEDDVPILILTARDALESRVEGLDAGADDYLVKPFERQELLARMRALLRRRPPRGSAPLRVGDLTLNADTHEVARGERAIELTQREFELLEYLMRNERIVISRQRLLDEVWGYDPFSTTNTIRCSSPTCVASSRRRETRACCTRSGEPATSSVRERGLAALQRAVLRLSASFDRLPIRVRLAGVSALLTFVILCAFAVAVGSLTVHRIRADFNRQVLDTANQLPSQLRITSRRCASTAAARLRHRRRPRGDSRDDPRRHRDRAVAAQSAGVRRSRRSGALAARLPGAQPARVRDAEQRGRRPRGDPVRAPGGRHGGDGQTRRARPADRRAARQRLRAARRHGDPRRAMAPIATLTSTAAEIARTRDPSRGVPCRWPTTR